MIPSYQPEAALEIFGRVVNGKDVETGKEDITPGYSTNGTSTSTHTDTLPPGPTPTCYLWGLTGTCADNQRGAVRKGTVKIKNYVITHPEQPNGTCPYTSTSDDAVDSELSSVPWHGDL